MVIDEKNCRQIKKVDFIIYQLNHGYERIVVSQFIVISSIVYKCNNSFLIAIKSKTTDINRSTLLIFMLKIMIKILDLKLVFM